MVWLIIAGVQQEIRIETFTAACTFGRTSHLHEGCIGDRRRAQQCPGRERRRGRGDDDGAVSPNLITRTRLSCHSLFLLLIRGRSMQCIDPSSSRALRRSRNKRAARARDPDGMLDIAVSIAAGAAGPCSKKASAALSRVCRPRAVCAVRRVRPRRGGGSGCVGAWRHGSVCRL